MDLFAIAAAPVEAGVDPCPPRRRPLPVSVPVSLLFWA